MMHGPSGSGNWAQDDIQGKIYDRRLFGKLLRYLKPYKWMVVVSFLILLVITSTELILPLITRTAIDKYITSDHTIAIFEDVDSHEAFIKRYDFLSRDEGRIRGRAFIIFSTKDRNKIDRAELADLEERHILSRNNIYIIRNQEDIKKLLNQSIEHVLMPQITDEGIEGWFELDEKRIAIDRNQFDKLDIRDRLKVRSDASNNLLMLALIFLLIISLRMIGSYFQAYTTSYFSQMAMNDLRHDVFAHLQKMPVKFFDQNPVGRLVTRVTNDIRTIDEMLASGVITIIQDFILIIGIVILLLILNWKLALVSISTLPLVVITLSIYKRKTRVIYREVRKNLAAVNATLAEHISGQKIIRLFNQYFHKKDQFAGINQTFFRTQVSQLKLFAFFRPIIHVSSQVSIALIIWYGGGQILRNVITIGLLMAFTDYVRKLFEPINDFSEKFDLLQGALAGAERIFDLMDKEADDYHEDKLSHVRFRGEIELDHVWLAYNNEEWVLKDICLKIKPGEKIALVGHTGSGKTSIVNMLLGMYPYQRGSVLIDGMPMQDYALADIRSNIGIVQQDVFIFSGNIKDNIALNNSRLTHESIVQVAKYVNADQFISHLPQKYDEPVMERGATLSTGQRQLIAFARVLAYNPVIFILDEATSNIDTDTEILIQDALHKIMQERTSIIIAHRLSTIQHVDRIIVLHKGEIVEEGSHFDLLDKRGLYYDLYRLQYT